jgi:hypothetical protein
MNPVDVNAKVPFKVAFEHPLSSAFAMGATAKPSAVTAAIAIVFATVLRFMILSSVFINGLYSGGDHSDRLFSFLVVQAERNGESGHVL